MEFYSYKRYHGDASTTDFAVPFEYLDKSHIVVTLNGEEVPQGQSYWFHTDYIIRFDHPPLDNTLVDIRRRTPREDLETVYQDASSLTARDMNRVSKQLLYISQEMHDDLRGALGGSNLGDLEGYVPDDETENAIVAEIAAKLAETSVYNELQQSREDFEESIPTILQNQTLIDEARQKALESGGLNESLAESAIEGFLRDNDRWEEGREDRERIVNIEVVNENHAGRLDSIETTVGLDDDSEETLLARVETLETTQVSQGDTLTSHASQIDTINSEIDLDGDGEPDIAATVTSHSDTLAAHDGDIGAHASQLDTINAEIDLDGDGEPDIASTVQTTADAVVAVEDDVETIYSRYTVKVDTNGRIAGYGIIQEEDDGETVASFDVVADQFSVTDPDTGDVKVGWSSSYGTFIVDGSVVVEDSLTAGAINIDHLSALSANLGTVTSGLFKTSNQESDARVEIDADGNLPMWYGAGTKNKDNAQFYLDDQGNAFFGGSLNVGDWGGSGAGLDIQDGAIKVYDSDGALRVHIGDLDA